MAPEATPGGQNPEEIQATEGAVAADIQVRQEKARGAGDAQVNCTGKQLRAKVAKCRLRQRQHSFPLFRIPASQVYSGDSILF